jgi:hypothetical protein
MGGREGRREMSIGSSEVRSIVTSTSSLGMRSGEGGGVGSSRRPKWTSNLWKVVPGRSSIGTKTSCRPWRTSSRMSGGGSGG